MSIDWSGIAMGSPLGRALRLPLRVIPKGTTVRIRRGPARGLKWIAGSANHGCWLGTYELQKQNAMMRFVKPGMTVYDIGAQAGFYTLFFSRLVGPEGRVCAFEPSANEVRYLLSHVNANRLANVEIIQAAVAERTGVCTFTFDRGATQNMIVNDDNTGLLVPTVSLDTMKLPLPDLIKMDVEGAESAVLAGAREIVDRCQPVLFVALHGPEQQEACGAILKGAGYRIYDLQGVEIRGSIQTDEIYALPGQRSEIGRGA